MENRSPKIQLGSQPFGVEWLYIHKFPLKNEMENGWFNNYMHVKDKAYETNSRLEMRFEQ